MDVLHLEGSAQSRQDVVFESSAKIGNVETVEKLDTEAQLRARRAGDDLGLTRRRRRVSRQDHSPAPGPGPLDSSTTPPDCSSPPAPGSRRRLTPENLGAAASGRPR